MRIHRYKTLFYCSKTGKAWNTSWSLGARIIELSYKQSTKMWNFTEECDILCKGNVKRSRNVYDTTKDTDITLAHRGKCLSVVVASLELDTFLVLQYETMEKASNSFHCWVGKVRSLRIQEFKLELEKLQSTNERKLKENRTFL